MSCLTSQSWITTLELSFKKYGKNKIGLKLTKLSSTGTEIHLNPDLLYLIGIQKILILTTEHKYPETRNSCLNSTIVCQPYPIPTIGFPTNTKHPIKTFKYMKNVVLITKLLVPISFWSREIWSQNKFLPQSFLTIFFSPKSWTN